MSVGGSVTRIDAVVRTVPDLAAAEAFYRDAMGFAEGGGVEQLGPDECALIGTPAACVRMLTMRLGDQSIGLLHFAPGGQPYPPDSTASDLWFQHCAVVVADMDAAFEAVAAHSIGRVSTAGPQQLPASTGGVRAFKFRDPFGHPLELLWFPDRVGDAVWHRANGRLFEGIDHGAIAVGHADESLGFYEDVLGFAPAGRTLNRGLAQDRLDGIVGVEVDVVALQPPQAPPHLELLGYRVGLRRRLEARSPADAGISRTLVTVDDPAATARKAVARRVPVHHGLWRGRDAVAFSDADGHAWICVAA